MRLSFIYPAALALLLVLVPLWAVSLAVPRRLSPHRFWASLAIRTTLIAALALALAGAQTVQGVTELTTVFLVDSSDSIGPSMRGRAEVFIQEALESMRPADQAAVVTFGANALVERVPSGNPALGRLTTTPLVERTNIQEALQLGLALFPADAQKRLVLLSDGGENDGRALEAARAAAARGVAISYVDLSSPDDSEVLLSSLAGPSRVRSGQEFELVATVESTLTGPARLRLFNDTRLLFDQAVQVQAGTNRFPVVVTAEDRGFQKFRAEVTAGAADSRSQNNLAEMLVRVDGAPRILLVEGTPGEADNFKRALDAAGLLADVVAPEAMPSDLAGLSDYEALALVNVAAQALPVTAVATIPAYVRELGRGLIMIGGDRSFGVGGYSRTPIEDALPVYMDVRNREERPDLALVFVIDKSGSMDACHCSGPNRQTAQFSRGGTPKVDIAKDAVMQASALLRPNDTIGVVAFDGSADWVVPAASGQSADALQSALAPVAPDGGTNVRAGLQAAEEALEASSARIRHAILLTDGWSGSGDNFDIAERMREQGITLSVVAAGSGSAEYLERLAEKGGGRYYPADSMEDVPSIFVQETITAVGNYLVEDSFVPGLVAQSPVFEGLESGLPQLYGYNGTTAKETATVALVGLDDAPLLAQWQYGLGRAIAWTSDVKGKWARDWVGWDQFPRFAAQLVGWVLPDASSSALTTYFQTDGAQTIVQVSARGDGDAPRDGLVVSARVVDGAGQTTEIGLSQVAPGEYRASLINPLQGTYLVQIVGAQNDQVVAQDTAGLVVPYSPEYRQNQSNPALLEALAAAGGGRRLERPADAFAPLSGGVTRSQEIGLPLVLLALALLPLDIAVRRFFPRRA